MSRQYRKGIKRSSDASEGDKSYCEAHVVGLNNRITKLVKSQDILTSKLKASSNESPVDNSNKKPKVNQRDRPKHPKCVILVFIRLIDVIGTQLMVLPITLMTELSGVLNILAKNQVTYPHILTPTL